MLVSDGVGQVRLGSDATKGASPIQTPSSETTRVAVCERRMEAAGSGDEGIVDSRVGKEVGVADS